MNTSIYMSGRQKYARPQGMLFSNNPGIYDDGKIIPDGTEFEDFIILSDDNRGPISFSVERIETRKRMVNGRQRSYHVADKMKVSTSWKMLPSRGYSSDPNFNNFGSSSLDPITGKEKQAAVDLAGAESYSERKSATNALITPSSSGIRILEDGEYVTRPKQFFTTDGGAGGAEILDWYNNNTGSFWVFLAYDNHNNFSSDEYNKLAQYNEVIEVMFADFSYSVEKRGASNYDFWNIDFSLEEV
jgi:hypothetical protein